MDTLLLVGKLAVAAALQHGRRPVFRLFVAASLPAHRREPLARLAREREIPVIDASAAELTALTGSQNHGGVAAEVGRRILESTDEAILYLEQLDHDPLAFALERFHEAHNLGYALRCVEALGADAVFLSSRDWGPEDAVVAQSSSGAYDRLTVAPLEDARGLVRRLEGIGIEAIAATPGATRSVYDFDLRAPVLIAVGGEFQGLSDEVKRACRHTAHIPMSDTIPSFPAGHAAALLAGEAARQRRRGGRAESPWPRGPSAQPATERAIPSGGRTRHARRPP